jgi:hypothetical protein
MVLCLLNVVAGRYLDLSDNMLTDSIPSGVGALSVLTYLALSDNQLTGSIPSSMSTLSALVYVQHDIVQRASAMTVDSRPRET